MSCWLFWLLFCVSIGFTFGLLNFLLHLSDARDQAKLSVSQEPVDHGRVDLRKQKKNLFFELPNQLDPLIL